MIDLILSSGLTYAGALLYNFGNYKSAIDNYSLAIQCNPQDEVAYINRGIARVVIAEYEAAIEDLNQTLQINPQNAQAYAERGLARAMIGENEAAIEDCSRAIELNPHYYRAYYGRGAARSYMGNTQGAIQDYTHLVRLQPNAHSYYYLACQQYLHGNKAKAIKNLTKSIDYKYETDFIESLGSDIFEVLSGGYKYNPYPSYYIRGNIFYELGDQEAAFEDYQEAIEIENKGITLVSDNDEHGFWGRGLAKYHQGNKEGAIEDLQKAAEVALKFKSTAFHQRVSDLLTEITSSQ
jgi:tetratricopeptide (TPR) repeat protein